MLRLGLAQQMGKQGGLEVLRNFINELRDGIRRVGPPADLDGPGRAEKLVCDRFDLSRQGRGEEEGLPFRRQCSDDAPDVRQEAHVEHSLGLVEHEEVEAGEIAQVPAHQVEQPAGCGHQQVHPRAKRLDLRPFAYTAINRGGAQGEVPAVCAHVLLDLRGQLTRRRHDERADAPRALAAPEWGRSEGGSGVRPRGRATIAACPRELREDRQYKGGGFAGAGLCDANEVVPGENLRDGGGLDGSWFSVAGVLDGFENVGVEAKTAKGHGLE